MKNFLSAVENRRSIYGIGKKLPITDQKIKDLLAHALDHAPSAMNSQSARLVLLLGKNHDRLWEIVTEALKKKVPADKFGPTQKKLDGFAAGYGTLLFFEDEDVIKGLQQQYALYADNFPKWSQQSSGMLQYIIWTGLEAHGLGASLQHYNPLIDDAVRSEWGLPQSWMLIAQMPFGNPTASPGEKEMLPVEQRLKVFE